MIAELTQHAYAVHKLDTDKFEKQSRKMKQDNEQRRSQDRALLNEVQSDAERKGQVAQDLARMSRHLHDLKA